MVPERKAVSAPPGKKKLIKPDHGPEPEDWPVPEPDPEPVRARVKRSPHEKHEIFYLKRLVALQQLWDDEKLATALKIPLVKHVINVPRRVEGKFNKALEKLLIKERGEWVRHVNQNPRNRMTDDRAYKIIEKAV